MVTYSNTQNVLVRIRQTTRVVAQAANARHGTRVIVVEVKVEPRRQGQEVVHGASLLAFVGLARQIAGARVARGNLGRRAGNVGLGGRIDVEVTPNLVHLLVCGQDLGDVVQIGADTKERNRRVAPRSAVVAGVRPDAAWHRGEDVGHVLTILHAVTRRAVLLQRRGEEVIVANDGQIVCAVNSNKIFDVLVWIIVDRLWRGQIWRAHFGELVAVAGDWDDAVGAR